jgi:predicted dehydrogenase
MESSSVSPDDNQPNAVPVGIVVVGTGFIADEHIGALRGRRDAELIGVVDTDPDRAAAAARRNGGVPYTTDLAEALAWPGVDACVVCTPNGTHHALAMAVARAGKHLLIEKPLTVTVPQAREAADAFAAAGTVLMAAHTHRFYDYGRAVKNAVDAGEVGRPELVRLAILGDWIWPDWRAWVLDPAASGGHALHNGVHLLDLATWWLGARPESVHARGRRQTAAELEIHDYLEMVVRYTDGSVAVCEMSRGHRTGGVGIRDVLVLGSEGLLTLPWNGDAAPLLSERGYTQLAAPGSNGFAVQLGAWLDAIAGHAPAMPVEDAVLAVAMGVAAERSIAEGRPVPLAEVDPAHDAELPGGSTA